MVSDEQQGDSAIHMHVSILPQGFPSGSDGKKSACNVGDLGSIPGWGRSPGWGNSYPLQYSCLENPMDRGAWRATVYGAAKSRTQLSNQALNTLSPKSPLPPRLALNTEQHSLRYTQAIVGYSLWTQQCAHIPPNSGNLYFNHPPGILHNCPIWLSL